MTDKEKLDAIRAEIHRLVDVRGYDREMANDLFAFMDSLPNEPVSEDLEEAAYYNCIDRLSKESIEDFKAGAKWQKQQDKSTIELAEDHAYFAGRTKTMDEINEALLSEVLPCFMHGGEADEVVAKLDEVLKQKK